MNDTTSTTFIENNTSIENNAWHTEWCDNETKKEFILYKSDGSTLCIKKGDWVKIPGRNDKAIIDDIIKSTKKNETSGPLGISYLPWRYNEKRFASVFWTMKGNRRFIICYPCGRNHFGEHIQWDQFELCVPPDNINVEMVGNVLETFHD